MHRFNQNSWGRLLIATVGSLWLLVATTTVTLQAQEVSIGYDSRYIGSGRSNALDHGGHFVFTAAVSAENGFGIDLWQSVATSVNSKETNLTTTYDWENDSFALGTGLRWLYFDSYDHSDDWDVLVRATAKQLPGSPQLYYVHSTRANGGILTLKGGTEVDFASGELAFSAGIGWESGYVSNDYDGLNHLEFHVNWSRPISEQIKFTTHIGQIIALENLDREDQGNWTWGGFGVSASF